MKAVAVSLKLQFGKNNLCLLLRNHNHLRFGILSDGDIQIFLNGDVLLNGS